MSWITEPEDDVSTPIDFGNLGNFFLLLSSNRPIKDNSFFLSSISFRIEPVPLYSTWSIISWYTDLPNLEYDVILP